MQFLRHLLPLLSAVLLWASFPPLDLGFLGWVALVPLTVHAVRETKTWRAFLLAWLAGAFWFTAGLIWLRHTVPIGPYLVGAYMGLYLGVYAWAVRRITRSIFPLCVAAPVVWIALEYLRGHLFSGLPWLLVGYTQHRMDALIQAADIGGVWLVGAIVVLVNAVFARAFLVRGLSAWKDREFRVGAIVAAGILVLSLGYGIIRPATIDLREGPEYVVVQPNIPQDVKLLMRGATMEQARKIFRKHFDMTMAAVEEGKPALVVWPESVIYGGLAFDRGKNDYVKSLWSYRAFADTARRSGAPLLVGSEMMDVPKHPRSGRAEYFNSAIAVDPEKGIVWRYDKIHLVPFAEYVLLADVFPFIRDLSHKYMGTAFLEFTPGTEFQVFRGAGEPLGVLVCFEAIFPEISREFARNGAKIAVNISNEGWFRASAELDQMYAMARFRAIESRIAFVRATNTGISAFFAPTGETDAVLEVGGRRKEVEGVLRARVRVTDAGSIYRKVGDVVAWLACGFALAAFLLSFLRRRASHFA
ncbi:MAG: apolipoprotein N-acyltransferase [Planctomycetota bacterium]|jgi:apolipoprotein N-acyltransferase